MGYNIINTYQIERRNTDMNISDAVLEFVTELKEIFGEKLSKIILYGSYARGDYHVTSDVDIMILVTLSDEEIKRIENQVFDCAYDLEMKYGVDISPIIKNKTHYEYWVDTLPFYRNIQQEGVIVA